ncbi:glycosyltransferase [Patescibacteria group bacterium]|nr:glycosyltransferase [Patescibacteria group bacterium]
MKNISIVIPVYNEEGIINRVITTLCDFCKKNLRNYNWKIIIVDNNSTDRTMEIAKNLVKEFNGEIFYKFIPQKGKGLAIRESWKSFDADIYVFMDADLATDLSALPTLIRELENDNNLVIGSRFIKGSFVKRSLSREIVSRIFSIITRLMFGLKIKDYTCGFKGVDKNVINKILSQVKNNTFFFDTELVIRSAIDGLKIKEIPIIWEDRDKNKSRVNVLKVTKEYLCALSKLKKDIKAKNIL